eukprot:TRINITY_DN49096_c0_g1_i1.p1 TRINITY_DN49096_c0_g1~~TRINITY_DN49096_c0_g1_i1.p1  ORF type:complete len:3191 (-),score=715.94 TRINITY_DN49096_c0_g1_i1:185-8656(-)
MPPQPPRTLETSLAIKHGITLNVWPFLVAAWSRLQSQLDNSRLTLQNEFLDANYPQTAETFSVHLSTCDVDVRLEDNDHSEMCLLMKLRDGLSFDILPATNEVDAVCSSEEMDLEEGLAGSKHGGVERQAFYHAELHLLGMSARCSTSTKEVRPILGFTDSLSLAGHLALGTRSRQLRKSVWRFDCGSKLKIDISTQLAHVISDILAEMVTTVPVTVKPDADHTDEAYDQQLPSPLSDEATPAKSKHEIEVVLERITVNFCDAIGPLLRFRLGMSASASFEEMGGGGGSGDAGGEEASKLRLQSTLRHFTGEFASQNEGVWEPFLEEYMLGATIECDKSAGTRVEISDVMDATIPKSRADWLRNSRSMLELGRAFPRASSISDCGASREKPLLLNVTARLVQSAYHLARNFMFICDNAGPKPLSPRVLDDGARTSFSTADPVTTANDDWTRRWSSGSLDWGDAGRMSLKSAAESPAFANGGAVRSGDEFEIDMFSSADSVTSEAHVDHGRIAALNMTGHDIIIFFHHALSLREARKKAVVTHWGTSDDEAVSTSRPKRRSLKHGRRLVLPGDRAATAPSALDSFVSVPACTVMALEMQAEGRLTDVTLLAESSSKRLSILTAEEEHLHDELGQRRHGSLTSHPWELRRRTIEAKTAAANGETRSGSKSSRRSSKRSKDKDPPERRESADNEGDGFQLFTERFTHKWPRNDLMPIMPLQAGWCIVVGHAEERRTVGHSLTTATTASHTSMDSNNNNSGGRAWAKAECIAQVLSPKPAHRLLLVAPPLRFFNYTDLPLRLEFAMQGREELRPISFSAQAVQAATAPTWLLGTEQPVDVSALGLKRTALHACRPGAEESAGLVSETLPLPEREGCCESDWYLPSNCFCCLPLPQEFRLQESEVLTFRVASSGPDGRQQQDPEAEEDFGWSGWYRPDCPELRDWCEFYCRVGHTRCYFRIACIKNVFDKPYQVEVFNLVILPAFTVVNVTPALLAVDVRQGHDKQTATSSCWEAAVGACGKVCRRKGADEGLMAKEGLGEGLLLDQESHSGLHGGSSCLTEADEEPKRLIPPGGTMHLYHVNSLSLVDLRVCLPADAPYIQERSAWSQWVHNVCFSCAMGKATRLETAFLDRPLHAPVFQVTCLEFVAAISCPFWLTNQSSLPLEAGHTGSGCTFPEVRGVIMLDANPGDITLYLSGDSDDGCSACASMTCSGHVQSQASSGDSSPADVEGDGDANDGGGSGGGPSGHEPPPQSALRKSLDTVQHTWMEAGRHSGMLGGWSGDNPNAKNRQRLARLPRCALPVPVTVAMNGHFHIPGNGVSEDVTCNFTVLREPVLELFADVAAPTTRFRIVPAAMISNRTSRAIYVRQACIEQAAMQVPASGSAPYWCQTRDKEQHLQLQAVTKAGPFRDAWSGNIACVIAADGVRGRFSLAVKRWREGLAEVPEQAPASQEENCKQSSDAPTQVLAVEISDAQEGVISISISERPCFVVGCWAFGVQYVTVETDVPPVAPTVSPKSSGGGGEGMALSARHTDKFFDQASNRVKGAVAVVRDAGAGMAMATSQVLRDSGERLFSQNQPAKIPLPKSSEAAAPGQKQGNMTAKGSEGGYGVVGGVLKTMADTGGGVVKTIAHTGGGVVKTIADTGGGVVKTIADTGGGVVKSIADTGNWASNAVLGKSLLTTGTREARRPPELDGGLLQLQAESHEFGSCLTRWGWPLEIGWYQPFSRNAMLDNDLKVTLVIHWQRRSVRSHHQFLMRVAKPTKASEKLLARSGAREDLRAEDSQRVRLHLNLSRMWPTVILRVVELLDSEGNPSGRLRQETHMIRFRPRLEAGASELVRDPYRGLSHSPETLTAAERERQHALRGQTEERLKAWIAASKESPDLVEITEVSLEKLVDIDVQYACGCCGESAHQELNSLPSPFCRNCGAVLLAVDSSSQQQWAAIARAAMEGSRSDEDGDPTPARSTFQFSLKLSSICLSVVSERLRKEVFFGKAAGLDVAIMRHRGNETGSIVLQDLRIDCQARLSQRDAPIPGNRCWQHMRVLREQLQVDTRVQRQLLESPAILSAVGNRQQPGSDEITRAHSGTLGNVSRRAAAGTTERMPCLEVHYDRHIEAGHVQALSMRTLHVCSNQRWELTIDQLVAGALLELRSEVANALTYDTGDLMSQRASSFNKLLVDSSRDGFVNDFVPPPTLPVVQVENLRISGLEIGVWGSVELAQLPTAMLPATLAFLLPFLSLSDSLCVEGSTLFCKEWPLKELHMSLAQVKTLFLIQYNTPLLIFLAKAFGCSNLLQVPKLILNAPFALGQHLMQNMALALDFMDLSVLSMDAEYIDARQERKAQEAVDSLQEGVEMASSLLIEGFFHISDVLVKPKQKFDKAGLRGVPEGLCRGVLSAVVKFLDGIVQAVSALIKGISAACVGRFRRKKRGGQEANAYKESKSRRHGYAESPETGGVFASQHCASAASSSALLNAPDATGRSSRTSLPGLHSTSSMSMPSTDSLGMHERRLRGPRGGPALQGETGLRMPRLLFGDSGGSLVPFVKWHAQVLHSIGPDLAQGICAAWRLCGSERDHVHLALCASHTQLKLVDLNGGTLRYSRRKKHAKDPGTTMLLEHLQRNSDRRLKRREAQERRKRNAAAAIHRNGGRRSRTLSNQLLSMQDSHIASVVGQALRPGEWTLNKLGEARGTMNNHLFKCCRRRVNPHDAAQETYAKRVLSTWSWDELFHVDVYQRPAAVFSRFSDHEAIGEREPSSPTGHVTVAGLPSEESSQPPTGLKASSALTWVLKVEDSTDTTEWPLIGDVQKDALLSMLTDLSMAIEEIRQQQGT